MFRNRKEHESEPTHQGTELKDYFGTYRGFSPTDESAICMGELEVTISEESVKIRMATGLKIEEDEFPTSMLQPMPKEMLSLVFNPGSEYLERCVGFHAGSEKYVFTPNAKIEDIGLVIKGSDDNMRDLLGPTLLFSPAQVKAGLYDEAVKPIDKELPQIRYGGKAPRKGS